MDFDEGLRGDVNATRAGTAYKRRCHMCNHEKDQTPIKYNEEQLRVENQ